MGGIILTLIIAIIGLLLSNRNSEDEKAQKDRLLMYHGTGVDGKIYLLKKSDAWIRATTKYELTTYELLDNGTLKFYTTDKVEKFIFFTPFSTDYGLVFSITTEGGNRF
jgi:hypothetical protein